MITPTLPEVIRRALQRNLDQLHTAMPGVVVSYDATSQTADIRPAIKDVYRDKDGVRQVEDLPILPKVPVLFPRGGGFHLSFPLTAGDGVLLIFSEVSIDRWRESSQVTDPGDLRRHGLSGAVAIPGVGPADSALNDASASDLVLGKDGQEGKVVVKNDSVEIAGGADFVALAQKVLTELQAVKTAYDSHTHLYLPGPGASTTTATAVPPLPAPNSMAATKTKAT